MNMNYSTLTTQYTLPGVMHYLQEQFTKNEQNRIMWELEKGELKSRIAMLEGENKNLQNKLEKYQRAEIKQQDHDKENPEVNNSSSSNGKVSKDVLDLISDSKSELENTVKEISYLLRPLDLNNYHSQIINNDAGNTSNDVTNTLSLEKNNTLLADGSAEAKAQEQHLTRQQQSIQQQAERVPKENGSPLYQDLIISTGVETVDIIANNNSYIALYDKKEGLLQTFTISSMSLSHPPSNVFKISNVYNMWWLQASDFLLVLYDQGLKIINCTKGKTTTEFSFEFPSIISADFKDHNLLFNNTETSSLEVWKLEFSSNFEKISIVNKYSLEYSVAFKDCKFGITEKSLLLLGTTTLDIYNFETASLLASIPLPIPSSSSKSDTSESVFSLIINNDSSSLLIHTYDSHSKMDYFLIYSFERLAFVATFSSNNNLSVSSIEFDFNIIKIGYSNGLIELKNTEGNNIEAFYSEFQDHCKIKYIGHSNLLISTGSVLTSTSGPVRAGISLKYL